MRHPIGAFRSSLGFGSEDLNKPPHILAHLQGTQNPVIHKVDNYTTPDGVKHENERHIKTYVVVKKKGRWLLAQDHNTVIQGSNTAINQK